jgi:hypothetical protein
MHRLNMILAAFLAELPPECDYEAQQSTDCSSERIGCISSFELGELRN